MNSYIIKNTRISSILCPFSSMIIISQKSGSCVKRPSKADGLASTTAGSCRPSTASNPSSDRFDGAILTFINVLVFSGPTVAVRILQTLFLRRAHIRRGQRAGHLITLFPYYNMLWNRIYTYIQIHSYITTRIPTNSHSIRNNMKSKDYNQNEILKRNM